MSEMSLPLVDNSRGHFRPNLIPGVQIHPFNSAGANPRYILKDPQEKFYVITGQLGVQLTELLNGDYTLDELPAELTHRYKVRVAPGQIERFLDLCQRNSLLVEGSWPGAAMPRPATKRQREKLGLYKRLFAADGLLQALTRWRRLWFNPVTGLLALGLSAAAILFTLNPPDRAGLTAPLNQIQGGRQDWYLLLPILIFLVEISLHELAHGLACVMQGVRSGGFGFGLLWGLVPVFFTDTTDAYAIDNKYRRMLVSAAGPLVDWLFLGLFAILTWVTAPDSLAHRLALAYTAFPSAMLLLNLNPFLIRVDGYWMLADYLEEPNLRRATFSYLKAEARRLLHLKPAAPPATLPTSARRWVYLLYALIAGAWTLYFVLSFALSMAASITHMIAAAG